MFCPPRNRSAVELHHGHQVQVVQKQLLPDLDLRLPRPEGIFPCFEWKFARMEPLGGERFALYAMRYTGKEWIGVADALTLDECMKAIQDDPWFVL